MITEHPYPRRPLPTLHYSNIALALYGASLFAALVYLFINPFWGVVLLIFSGGMLAVNIKTRMKLIENREKVREQNLMNWWRYREFDDLNPTPPQPYGLWQIPPPDPTTQSLMKRLEDGVFAIGDVISDFAEGKPVCAQCGMLHKKSQKCPTEASAK